MSSADNVFDFTSLSAIPSILWEYYLENLWFYDQGSWVARVAYTFRVLAFLLIIPMSGITLLDIASYVIARTLGVVDDVKASTSDKNTIHSKSDTPIILLNDDTSPTSAPSTPLPNSLHMHKTERFEDEKVSTAGHPQAYFASDLTLSGVGVFSPAVSQPPSPTLSRRNLLEMDGNRTDGASSASNEQSRLRRRG